MRQPAILGIDVGTSSIKYGLLSLSGESVHNTSSEYDLINRSPGQFEIDPEALWRSIAASVRRIIELTSHDREIAAVCVCAMMIMPVFLDARGGVVRPIIHWQDERLPRESSVLKEQGKDAIIAKHSGSLLTGESTINAMYWVKENEPEAFRRIAKFVMIKDYIRFRLTGELCTDFGDASGSLMLDTAHRAWSDELIRDLAMPRGMFPDLARSDMVAGTITREAGALTLLQEGTPVVVGTGDGICTILGLGVVDEGEVGITIGSAGVIGVATGDVPIDSAHRNYVFCHPLTDRWYSIMATAASGDVLRWYRNSLIDEASLTYADLDAEASRSKPGTQGLIFLPYILGSRNPYSNPHASGVFLGLRRKYDRSHLTRSVLEGILLEMLDLYEAQKQIAARKGTSLNSVRVSGGIVKSSFWLKILADMLGKRIVLTEVDELGTLGCGILASSALGCYSSLKESIVAMVREKGFIEYDESANLVYRKKFKVFKEAYARLEPLFPMLEE